MGKSKAPLSLRIIPFVFPKVEKIAPSLANRFFAYIFFKPFRYKLPAKELMVAKSGNSYVELIDGRKIHCYSWGMEDGPVVLLVHGWAGRATQFRKFIPKLLEAGYFVVAFDGPAHGKSQGTKTNLEEFRSVVERMCDKFKNVKAIITHSFGGGATLYAVTKGLKIKTVVNIGTPTIADEIINTYLRAVGGSQKTGRHFKQYVLELTGKPFEAFTIMGFVNDLPRDLKLMLVHDRDDKEAPILHAMELSKAFPAELIVTEGLGHSRILKDDAVIDQVVTFIDAHSSGS